MTEKNKRIICLLASLSVFLSFTSAFADTNSDIQAKIDQISASKKELEQEIADYENQLKDIGTEKNTLSQAVADLNATIKKNSLDLKLTENNIDNTTLQIQQLSLNIDKNTSVISQDLSAVAELIREEERYSNQNLLENLLGYETLSEFWTNQKNLYDIQDKLKNTINDTQVEKQNLEDNKTRAEQKKKDLLALKSDLVDKQKILDITQKEKTNLLNETKDKEANYQKMLADKKTLSSSLDQELVQYESGLNLSFDASKIPPYNKGILSWPLDSIRITQLFGVTDFSKTTNAYNGQGHNGVDFAAPIGTRVKAALDGIVLGTGDTDTVCPGASFGKWIFIEHPNGLSTIYAHLSLIKVSAGDHVTTGQVIGYTGVTGFTTGPHLHFGVYASAGVEITGLKSKVCAGTYTIPVAVLEAYLDPLQYL